MNLDFFNDLVTKVKESDLIQNFITELSTYLANSKGKDNSEILNMNSIEKEYCLNSTSSKSLKQKRDEILENEARNLKDGESLYYTAYKNTFKDTPEAKWLKENAYKYGFILRYPEEFEEVTGITFEPWHYRYVGKDIAKYIYENNITFDEYYAYYLED